MRLFYLFQLLVSAFPILSQVPDPDPVAAEVFKRGDADGDGTVGLADVIFSLNYLFRGGKEPGCLDAADANDDGQVDVSDPIKLLLWLFRGDLQLPRPGSDRFGKDLTDDLLTCQRYGENLGRLELSVVPDYQRFATDVPLVLAIFELEAKHSISIESFRMTIYIERSTESMATIEGLMSLTLQDPRGTVLAGPKNPTSTTGEVESNPVVGQIIFSDPFTLSAGRHTVILRAAVGRGFQRDDRIWITLNPQGDLETSSPTIILPNDLIEGSSHVFGPAELFVRLFNEGDTRRVVAAGSQQVSVLQVYLVHPESAEATKLRSLNFLVQFTGDLVELYDWRIAINGRTLESIVEPPTANRNDATLSLKFTLREPYLIPPTELLQINITVSATTKAAGNLYLSLPDDVARAVGAISGTATPIAIVERNHDGPTTSFISSDLVRIHSRRSQSRGFLVTGLLRNVWIGDLQVEAFAERATIASLEFTGRRTNPGLRAGAWDQIRSISLYDEENRLLAETPIVPDDDDQEYETTRPALTLNPPLEVAPMTPRFLRIKVQTAKVYQYPFAVPGRSGQGFQLSIAHPSHVYAEGLESRTRLPVEVSEAILPEVTVLVSLAQVTLNEQLHPDERLPDGRLSNAQQLPLYRFALAADLSQDIGLRQIVIRLTRSEDVTVRNLILHDGQKVVAGGQSVASTRGILTVRETIRFRLDDFLREAGVYTISAGTRRLLEIRADVTTTAPHAFLGVQLLGDVQFPSLYPTDATSLGDRICDSPCSDSGNFLWTDYAYSGPFREVDPDVLTLPQWMNGFLVPTMDGEALPSASIPVFITRNE